MLVTAILHLFLIAYLLLESRESRLAGISNEARTQLILIEREPIAARPTPPPMPTPPGRISPEHQRPVVNQPTSTVTSQAPLSEPAGEVEGQQRPLVLSIPPVTSPGTFESDAMDRSKGPPAYNQTRFANAWTPDGGPIQKTWAHRSTAARLLLSATGALEFPCTDEEKRLRKPRCSGAQYAHDETPGHR